MHTVGSWKQQLSRLHLSHSKLFVVDTDACNALADAVDGSAKHRAVKSTTEWHADD